MVVALLGVPLLVVPAQEPPRGADVVFVIGPPDAWRTEWARELAAAGKAGTIMVSVPEPATTSACRTIGSTPVLCRRPDPFTTRGEARWLRDEMDAHGWRTALVITSTPHVSRTRFVMSRCVPQGVQVVGRRTGLTLPDWAYQYAYQPAAWVKALVQSGC